MLRCVEFVEQVTTIEEHAAPPRPLVAFQLHRWICRHCRRYLRQMRAVRGALWTGSSDPLKHRTGLDHERGSLPGADDPRSALRPAAR